MSIGKTLYVNFGKILVIVLVLFAINFFSVRREHIARHDTNSATEVLMSCEQVRRQMFVNRVRLRNFLIDGKESEAELLRTGSAKLSDDLKDAESKAISDSQLDALRKFSDSEANWLQNFAGPLMEKRRAVTSGQATMASLHDFFSNQMAIDAAGNSDPLLNQAEAPAREQLVESRKVDDFSSSLTTWISLLAILAVLGAGGFITYRAAKAISEPLHRLIAVARDIGESGGLDHNMDIMGQDEIQELSDLGRSFSGMVSYLNEMAAISEAIAGGDLSNEVEPRSKRDVLGQAFARMTEGLGSLARTVRDSAAQVASGSGQVANASEESAKVSVQSASAIEEVTSTMHEMSINVQNMVRSTQMQATSVSDTSSSIDQMVASIQRVADTSKVLLDISNRSRQEVQNGISSMDKATDGLNRINTSIHSSAEIIGVLGQRADDIGKIIEVIDDLAEQTNLLALNAAIEAARAGEHGLGFAVVADEVRKLAEKSAQSTKEISELIQSIQKEARKAVENMDKSTTIVNEGLLLGGELGGALKKISNVVTEVYKFAQEIGAATNEQSHGSTQIARATTRLNEITHEINSSVEEQASGTQAVVKAMERMRELVQQSTSGSTELAASAEEMSKMARSLLDIVGRFKLDTMESELDSHLIRRSAAAMVGMRG
jgi:methyl-accepting chemotaxis protein